MKGNEKMSEIEVWLSAPKGEMGHPFSPPVRSSEVEDHAFAMGSDLPNAVETNAVEFIQSWRKAYRAVEAVFATDGESDQESTFQLETIVAKLSITASGKVVFIGELGGEVSFEATFARK